MIRVVTDATPWLAFFSAHGCVPLELALEAGALEVPPLIQTELLGNVFDPKHRRTLEEILIPISIANLHPAHWARAGQLKAQLAEKGFFLTARDAHVVQCAIDREAVLLSSDPLLTQIQKYSGVTVQIW